MDIILKIRLPQAICEMKMAVTGNAIIARLSISVQIPAGTVCIVVDGHWHSADLWEKDVRMGLETLVNQENAIVEAHIRNTVTATEQRIRTVLLEVLGFSDR